MTSSPSYPIRCGPVSSHPSGVLASLLTPLSDALVLVLLLLLFTIYRMLMKTPVNNDYDSFCYPSSLAHVAQALQL